MLLLLVVVLFFVFIIRVMPASLTGVWNFISCFLFNFLEEFKTK